jgi:hypothetical protein
VPLGQVARAKLLMVQPSVMMPITSVCLKTTVLNSTTLTNTIKLRRYKYMSLLSLHFRSIAAQIQISDMAAKDIKWEKIIPLLAMHLTQQF